MTAESGTAGAPVRRTNSLLFNVSTLLQEPIGSSRRFHVDRAAERSLDTEVSGTLRLLRTDQSVLATAALTTTVRDVCGGCLIEVDVGLELTFDEEFWPSMDPVSGLSIEPPPERVGFAVIDGQIDLSEAVRQYVEMQRPMSPRCGADCPGLETNTSTEAPVDDRWSALSALKLELKGD